MTKKNRKFWKLWESFEVSNVFGWTSQLQENDTRNHLYFDTIKLFFYVYKMKKT